LQLIQLLHDLMTRCYEGKEHPAAILEQAKSQIFQFANREIHGGFEPTSELVHAACKEIEEARRNREFVSGIDTGFADLNRMTGGPHNQNLAQRQRVMEGRHSAGSAKGVGMGGVYRQTRGGRGILNERQLAKWLMDLAACYEYVPQKAAIATYLRILRQWKLSPEQWEELADRALMRLTQEFPMPGELYEIASELWWEAELRANSEYLDRMRADWQQQTERG
jgi:hypothetical protein